MKVIGLGDNVVDKYEHVRMMYPGGNALNFAVFACQLGVEAGFLGAFGDDPEGRHVAESAGKAGVDLSRCRYYHGENGCARVCLRDGDRKFIGSNRCGVLRTVGLDLVAADYEYLLGFDLIHSGIFGFSEKSIRELKHMGARISFDFSSSFNREYLDEVLPSVDYPVFSCSHLEIAQMEQLMRYAVGLGCRMVLCTRGAQGAWLADGQRVYRQKPQLVTAKDTMAAGDSFLTCFLVNYLQETLERMAEHETAIRLSLERAAVFAAGQCLVDGSWGYGISY